MSFQIIAFLNDIFTFINEYDNLLLVVVTALYIILTYKLSAESKMERRYQYLQKRRDYLYSPLTDVFSSKFDLNYRKTGCENNTLFQIGENKNPEIIKCFHPDLKLGNVKSYLYMAPPDLKKLFDDWAKEVSELTNPENRWSEEEAGLIIKELNDSFKEILVKTNE